MNIAVLLTGPVRTTLDTFENLKFAFKNLNPHKIDYFCATWYDETVDFKLLNEKFKFKVLDIQTYNDYTVELIKDYDKFKDFFNNYKNDDPEYLKFHRDETIKSPSEGKHTPLIFYNLYRGFNLIERYSRINDIKYDIILRSRFDVGFRKCFTEEHLNKVIYDDTLYVACHNYEKFKNSKLYDTASSDLQDYHKHLDGWIDELMFYSNYETFKKYKDLYQRYYEIAYQNNIWIIHLIMKYYIQEKNIKINITEPWIDLRRDGYIIYPFDYLYQ